jgi:2-polyprenyl-3-methyl-5-hydroxy-6-metoxy-1,4-benzoquinol methylase
LIEWSQPAFSETEGKCPVCSAEKNHAPVLTVDNLFEAGNQLHFSRCSACGSLFARKGKLFEYTDNNAIGDEHLRHYLHVGAGIDSMVRPLDRVFRQRGESLLDVGCGFGFTLDYWKTMTGGRAVGIEPSGYGKMGSAQLGVEIYNQYLDEVSDLRGERFDIVYSSEVIEHVPDPTAFLREMRARLLGNGILVLTTPNADYVNREASPIMLLATLSPGLHKFLFSAKALQKLLLDVGFLRVRVEVHRERLVAFASEQPLEIDDEKKSRCRYIKYLEKRVEDSALPVDLRLGLSFRAFKELVNDGKMKEGNRYRDIYAKATAEAIGLDALNGRTCINAAKETVNFITYFKHLPYCQGVFLFYLAMHARHSEKSYQDTARLFEAAAFVLSESVKLAPEHFQEAATLVWLARFECGNALLAAGDRDAAIKCFDNIIQQPTESLYNPESDKLVQLRSCLQRAIANLQLGKVEQARADLTKVKTSNKAPAWLQDEIKKLDRLLHITT